MFPSSYEDADRYRDWQCRQGLDRHEIRATRENLACKVDVTVHPGVYVFTAAIVMSLVVVQRMAVLARRAVAQVGGHSDSGRPPQEN